MFEQATLSTAPASSRLLSTCAGVTGQALIVGCMLVAPLIWPQVLPQMRSYITLAPPGPPPPPPVPVTTVQPRSAQHTVARQWKPDGFYAPRSIPAKPLTIDDPPEIGPPGVVGGMQGAGGGGTGPGVVGSILNEMPAVVAPPRQVAPPVIAKVEAPAAPPRVRVGGLVKLASPIRRVEPAYPPLARTARIEGVVQLEGVIGIDGRIHELKVLSGHPLLIKSAVEAVQQWLYAPGTLNGDLVEVVAPITVTFRLGH
jgi:protein TonB